MLFNFLAKTTRKLVKLIEKLHPKFAYTSFSRFRAFSCENLLRVICQRSRNDRTPILTKVNKVEKQIEENNSLENQVPESIIRANPKKPIFKVNGLTNPYLNYHAKQLKRRQKLRQQQLELRQQQLESVPFNLRLFFSF